MTTRSNSRHGVWRRPVDADLSFLSRAAHEHAEPPATATESKLLAASLGPNAPRLSPPPCQTFWEVWAAMGERGGFYVRKPSWAEGSRFCVAAVVDHSDGSGRKVVLGRLFQPGVARSARLTQDLELRVWQADGVTWERRRGRGLGDVA